MKDIWKRGQHLLKVALGRQRAGRHLTIFPDDVFLTSYPRSGNTWTRFLIANLISTEPVTFANIETKIPEIYLHSDRDLKMVPRPRILKSHEYFDPRYKKLIYIVRDPRDVMVSMYYYSAKRRDIPDGYPMEQFVPRALAGEFFEDWGTWENHVNSWRFTQSSRRSLLLLRYEDMLANPFAELGKVAELLSMKVEPEQIQQAVDSSGADRMRNLERRDALSWKLTKSTRQDIPFVREAKSGGWREKLPAECVEQLERAWGPTMEQLGYKPVTEARKPQSKGALV